MKNNLAEFSLENLEVVIVMLSQILDEEEFTEKQVKIFRKLKKEVWITYSEIKEKLQGYSKEMLPEIMKSLTESQPHLLLTTLERKSGISEENAVEHLIEILKKHTHEYNVGSSLKTSVIMGKSFEYYDYSQYVAMALVFMELVNRMTVAFNRENDSDLGDGDESTNSHQIQENDFPIIDMLINWGADINSFFDSWINNSNYPILNEYCFNKILKNK